MRSLVFWTSSESFGTVPIAINPTRGLGGLDVLKTTSILPSVPFSTPHTTPLNPVALNIFALMCASRFLHKPVYISLTDEISTTTSKVAGNLKRHRPYSHP